MGSRDVGLRFVDGTSDLEAASGQMPRKVLVTPSKTDGPTSVKARITLLQHTAYSIPQTADHPAHHPAQHPAIVLLSLRYKKQQEARSRPSGVFRVWA